MSTLLPLYRLATILNSWFAGLPNDIVSELERRGRLRTLASGQYVYARGDVPEGIYRVLNGSVKLSGLSRDGHETVLDFYGPGVWFGEVSALDGLPRTHDACANSECEFLHVNAADLEELLAKSPQLSRALLRIQALRTRIVLTAIETYTTQSLEQRMANRLLMLAVNHGSETPDGVKIDLHLPQETLAQLVGATRQRVNQILKDWETERIVDQAYGRIVLRDAARLKRLAET